MDCHTGDESVFSPISILNKAVEIIGVAPEKFHGMDRFEARKVLLEDLGQDLLHQLVCLLMGDIVEEMVQIQEELIMVEELQP